MSQYTMVLSFVTRPCRLSLWFLIFLGACQSLQPSPEQRRMQAITDHCETVARLDTGRIEARMPFVENAEPGLRINRTRILEITRAASYQGCLQRFSEETGEINPATTKNP